MNLRHLRQNAVAYLALAVALGTGTAYAADQIANGSVTTKKLAKNAVTSPKIKKNAVRSVDVKDGALTAGDLAPGVVPGVTWVGGRTIGNGDPSASPDHPALAAHAFTLPRAGTLQVSAFFEGISLACMAGTRYVGLYVDGAPVAGTRVALDSSPAPMASLGLLTVGAGPHTVTVGLDCPDGASGGYDMVLRTYSLALGA
jgi:hypothetical protein